MRRVKYALTFLSIVLSVLSAFYWYRSSGTATDACVLYLSPTRSLQMVIDGGAVFLFHETREPPILPGDWADMSRFSSDSKYQIGQDIWQPPRFAPGRLGIGWGRDERWVLRVHVWDAGVRLALPLLAALFLILPVVRGYRSFGGRLSSAAARTSSAYRRSAGEDTRPPAS